MSQLNKSYTIIILLRAMSHDVEILEDLPEELKTDEVFAWECVERDGTAIRFFSEDIQQKADLVALALSNTDYSFPHLPEKFRADRNIIRRVITYRPGLFGYVPQTLKEDRAFIEDCLNINTGILPYVSEALQSDIELFKKAISIDPFSIAYGSDEIKDNSELARMAIIANSNNLQNISNRLRNSAEMVLLAIRDNGDFITHAGDQISQFLAPFPHEEHKDMLKKMALNEKLDNELNAEKQTMRQKIKL